MLSEVWEVCFWCMQRVPWQKTALMSHLIKATSLRNYLKLLQAFLDMSTHATSAGHEIIFWLNVYFPSLKSKCEVFSTIFVINSLLSNIFKNN